jgi:hypothetical protein
MTLRTCPHEKDVTELLARGHYPQACPPELHAHLEGCRSCADLVLVTRAFQTARAQTAAAANLPAPGLLWWRAQLRRRNEAVERIGKPILGAQIFALAVSVLFAIAFLATQATHGLRWTAWFDGVSWPAQAPALHLDTMIPASLFSSSLGLLVAIPVCATLLLLAGVAIYLASERKNENEPR